MKFFKHSSLYLVGTIAPLLVQLLVTPAVTRILGPEQYGFVSVAIVTAQASVLLASLGLAAAITRHVLLEHSAAQGGARILVMGTTLALGILSTASFVFLVWMGSDNPLARTMVYAFIASAGLSAVTMTQAFWRGLQRPIPYVCLGIAVGLLGPTAGLIAILIAGPRAEIYYLALASTQFIIGMSTVGFIAIKSKARPIWTELVSALRVGLPTVPHSASGALLPLVAVYMATQIGGVPLAGSVQLAVLFGTAPTLVISAVNNAWAPEVYKTDTIALPVMLKRSSTVVALIALVLVASHSLVAPIVIPVIAGPVSNPAMIQLSMLIAGSTALSVAYLANIHYTFIAGRTWPLAFTSPLSTVLGITVLYGLLFYANVASPQVFASLWLVYYLAQAIVSFSLAKKVGLGVVPFSSLVPAAIAALIPALTVSLAWNQWFLALPISGIAVILGVLWTRRISHSTQKASMRIQQ